MKFRIHQSNHVPHGDFDKIFEAIADFEKYPEFVPWIKKTTMKKVAPNEYETSWSIFMFPFAIKGHNRMFIDDSSPTLKTIRTESLSKNWFFRDKLSVWKIEQGVDHVKVEFEAHFEFQDFLKNMVEPMIDKVSEAITQGFMKRLLPLTKPLDVAAHEREESIRVLSSNASLSFC